MQPEYLCVDFDLKYQATLAPPEICRRGSVKKGGSRKAPQKHVKVIDICCGRGGDLNKLTREFLVDFSLVLVGFGWFLLVCNCVFVVFVFVS